MALRLRIGLTIAGVAGASLAVVTAADQQRHTVAGAPHAVTAPPMQPAAVLYPGYWLVASDGGIFPFGSAQGYGSTGGMHLNQPIVGMTASPDKAGYWLVAADGGIFPFGSAKGKGSTGGMHLNQPIVGMAATTAGNGYWLVARDGGIFPFGTAGGYGSTGGMHLNQPIVGMARTSTGKGYWLVASDGGIFPFGDAVGYGSTGGMHLNKPIVGMAALPSGKGYWLVASDGGIFPFGGAQGYGSTGAMHLNQPIVGMAAAPDGRGYWLVAADGGIFPFGSAPGVGSTGGMHLNQPIVGMAAAGQALGSSDKVTGSPGATTVSSAGGASGILCTFTLTDQTGKPIPQADLLFSTTNLASATLSAPSATTDGNGQVTVTMFDSTAGDSGTVDATIAGTGVRGSAGPFTITAANPSSISGAANPSGSVNADTGHAGIHVTFTVKDAHNNPVSGLTVSLSSGLGSAAFNPVNPVTNSQGVASSTLTDTHAGDSGTVTGTVAGLPPVQTASITITNGAYNHFTLTGFPTMTAGVANNAGQLTQFDSWGNQMASGKTFSFAGTALAASPSGQAGNAPQVVGDAPVKQVTVTAYRASASALLTGSDGTGFTTNSNSFAINAGTPNAPVVTPTSFTAASGGQQQAFTVTETDSWSNPINDSLMATLTARNPTADGGMLTGTDGNPTSDDTAGPVSVTVTITNGTGSFTYTAPPVLPGGRGDITFDKTVSPTSIAISD